LFFVRQVYNTIIYYIIQIDIYRHTVYPKRENGIGILGLCSKVLLKIFLNMLFTDMVQYLKSFEEPVSV